MQHFGRRAKISVTSLSQFEPEILSYKGGPLVMQFPEMGIMTVIRHNHKFYIEWSSLSIERCFEKLEHRVQQ